MYIEMYPGKVVALQKAYSHHDQSKDCLDVEQCTLFVLYRLVLMLNHKLYKKQPHEGISASTLF